MPGSAHTPFLYIASFAELMEKTFCTRVLLDGAMVFSRICSFPCTFPLAFELVAWQNSSFYNSLFTFQKPAMNLSLKFPLDEFSEKPKIQHQNLPFSITLHNIYTISSTFHSNFELHTIPPRSVTAQYTTPQLAACRALLSTFLQICSWLSQMSNKK